MTFRRGSDAPRQRQEVVFVAHLGLMTFILLTLGWLPLWDITGSAEQDRAHTWSPGGLWQE